MEPTRLSEVISRHIDESPDTLEIGTPGKGGALKIKGDFNKPKDFKMKIDNAVEARKYAQAALEIKV